VPAITCIEDLRVLAQRRVPRMFYDYADSGSWTESTYRANESDFQRIKLRQRVAVNMAARSTRTEMVGQEVAMRFCRGKARGEKVIDMRSTAYVASS
jgi:L-lactate dehydrogenase (cytochrome)